MRLVRAGEDGLDTFSLSQVPMEGSREISGEPTSEFDPHAARIRSTFRLRDSADGRAGCIPEGGPEGDCLYGKFQMVLKSRNVRIRCCVCYGHCTV